MDELDLTAAESKATYEEIKDYVLKQSGLKVSNLYIAQVKQKCGIIERANYNLPKSENSRQPKCPPEKEAAIREDLYKRGQKELRLCAYRLYAELGYADNQRIGGGRQRGYPHTAALSFSERSGAVASLRVKSQKANQPPPAD